ncbi:DNA repair protein RAD51 homolog 2 isoform X11 [Anas platyrhynchos]
MMSVLATLPVSMGGLDGAVVYIDTESAFSAERLVEIAGNRFPTYFDSDEKLFCMTRSVHLYRELTCDSVLKRIKSLEEEIISKKVKLIIIDSVASVVRKEFDTKLQGNLAERSNFLARGASLLKYLAEEFSIPVILTNQITTSLSNGLAIPADLVSPADDLFLSEVSGASGSGKKESGCVTAALGNTWSHSVNTRLILQYHELPTRQILVAKSPVAPFSVFFYTIEKSGLVLQAHGQAGKLWTPKAENTSAASKRQGISLGWPGEAAGGQGNSVSMTHSFLGCSVETANKWSIGGNCHGEFVMWILRPSAYCTRAIQEPFLFRWNWETRQAGFLTIPHFRSWGRTDQSQSHQRDYTQQTS